MMDSRLMKTEFSHSAAVRALLALWNVRRNEASPGEFSTGLPDSSPAEGENALQLRERRLRQNARTGVSDPACNSKKGATPTLWFV